MMIAIGRYVRLPRRAEDGDGECYLNASCSTARWPSSMDLTKRRFLRRLGDQVRERRTAMGMTQAELAEKCALHRTFIGSVERGERNISVLNLRIIARALRLSIAQLLADSTQSADG